VWLTVRDESDELLSGREQQGTNLLSISKRLRAAGRATASGELSSTSSASSQRSIWAQRNSARMNCSRRFRCVPTSRRAREQAGAGNGKCERKSRLDGVEDDRRTMLLPRKQIGQSEFAAEHLGSAKLGQDELLASVQVRSDISAGTRVMCEEAGMRLEQAGAGNGKCERKSRLDGVEDDRRTMLFQLLRRDVAHQARVRSGASGLSETRPG
jgi:hypothetical protein